MVTETAGRTAAVVTAATATLHLVLAAQRGFDVSGVVMVMMAWVCARCAHTLWCRASARAWLMTSACNAAMAVVHLAGCAVTSPHMTGGMSMTADEHRGTGALSAGFTALDVLVLGMAALEAVVGLVAWARSHHKQLRPIQPAACVA